MDPELETPETVDTPVAPEPVQATVQTLEPRTDPEPAPPFSLLGLAKEKGVNLGDAADDQSAAARLLEFYQQRPQLEQLQQVAQYGQAVLPHWSRFQEYLRSQGQAQPAAQPQQQAQPEKPWHARWWNPPEYNPAWERQLTRDPTTGAIVAVPGAPPDLPLKYQQYQQYRQEQADRLLNNPYEYIREPVEDLATKIAEQAIQRHLQAFQERQVATGFVNQNSGWLYQQDPNGQTLTRPVLDQRTGQLTQQPVLSPYGDRFLSTVKELAQIGAPHETQQKFALMSAQLDHALTRLQQLEAGGSGVTAAVPSTPVTPVAADAAVKSDYLRRAATRRNSAGAAEPVPAPGAPPARAFDFIKREMEKRGHKIDATAPVPG